MTRVRKYADGGALMSGLVAVAISIGANIGSGLASPAQHPRTFGNGAYVVINPQSGTVVALGNDVTVIMNVDTGRIVTVSSGPRPKH